MLFSTTILLCAGKKPAVWRDLQLDKQHKSGRKFYLQFCLAAWGLNDGKFSNVLVVRRLWKFEIWYHFVKVSAVSQMLISIYLFEHEPEVHSLCWMSLPDKTHHTDQWNICPHCTLLVRLPFPGYFREQADIQQKTCGFMQKQVFCCVLESQVMFPQFCRREITRAASGNMNMVSRKRIAEMLLSFPVCLFCTQSSRCNVM